MRRSGQMLATAAAALAFVAGAASAADIGQIKVTHGNVTIQRGGQSLPATLGARLEQGDVVQTGADSSVGITMSDNSLLSAGPNSELALDQYSFDPTTNEGRFDTKLSRGTLAVVSGRIAKQSPKAMTVHTPGATLGVRGTEFVVSADRGRSVR
jgi:hypothetical protein